ncbi:hypothetical protein [Pedobacter sp. B4-66]|uniref:hypothetical protein n=1 Tax=Pedobacter sp. B4-66 TaxID=2817280 RepID=UPI001BD9B461|nr:hypothetical protein [Pedobacter sp. B4-66]
MSIYSVSEDTGVEALLIEVKTEPQRKAPLKEDPGVNEFSTVLRPFFEPGK